MDRRVRIIRGWLIVALAIAGALLIDPVLWFGLATILACEPCCATLADCSRCTTQTPSATVTLSGMANDTCSTCGDYDGTYADIPRKSGLCVGTENLSYNCGFNATPPNRVEWSIILGDADPGLGLSVALYIPCNAFAGEEFYQWWKENVISTNPGDCSGLGPVTTDNHTWFNCSGNQDTTPALCDGTSATVTIETA